MISFPHPHLDPGFGPTCTVLASCNALVRSIDALDESIAEVTIAESETFDIPVDGLACAMSLAGHISISTWQRMLF